MALPYSQRVRTLKTVIVAEPSTQTVFTSTPVGMSEGSSTYRTVKLAGAQLQPVQYLNSQVDAGAQQQQLQYINSQVDAGAQQQQLQYINSQVEAGAQLQPVQYLNSQVEGNVMYGGARYLVPMQQRRPAESVMYLSQAPRVMQPVYFQNVQNVQPVSADETDVYTQVNINGQTSVFSQLSSPVKSSEPSESELVETSSIQEEVVDLREIKNGHSEIKTEIIDVEPVAKMDNRFFGELLAEVYRKNSDIHTCISEHVAKIRGRKHLLDPTIDYKVEKEEIESVIPKGVSELTKQQIRYLLQTRMTADKTMRLLMATFSSLREELVHMQDDLRRLESEKEELERDLSFKADQALQYDRLLETVREHNRQLQAAVKESNNTQRTLESQLLTWQSKDPSKDFRIKELEGSKRALEQENELLKKKLAGQCSSSTVQIKTQELSREYEQMLKDLREEKDRELKNMRTQLVKIQTERTITQTSDSGLEMRISELLSKLEQHESVIRHQEEEIRRLKQQKIDNSSSTTKTVVTKRYMNQYPLLGLLSDDYQYKPPIKEDRTVIIKSTGVTSRIF
ncbi:protein POF1B-like isoform X1 [Sinocyclocheilus grahami]|uniref:Protein POF1B-like n=1 Tax=Sinocyclocheilus grahami TaxID=75366 RepID=A0A672T5E4_SINGR|nr:PREDICTED: protein POF1B-like isoform X1 [Sinocyclocheilus grahami]